MLLQDNDHLSFDLEPAETHASTPAITRRSRKQPIEREPALINALVTILDSLRPVLSSPARKQIAGALLLGPRKRRRRVKPAPRGITVGKLCKQYLDYAQGYYHPTEGGSQAESTTVMYALRPLRKLFARIPVIAFGPRKLMAVRDAMIQLGWCRNHINQQLGRIKRMFKWGVENELIPPSLFHAVQAVRGLRAGRSDARESPPVKPVPDELLEPVIDCASTQVGAMIRLQLLTGMRPGEVCTMRTRDIDTSKQPWVYRPEHHKTEHHNHERLIFIGPKGQEVIKPFLKTDRADAYLFSPADAEDERRRRLHARRKTPITYGNRPGTNRKRHPRRVPGDRYISVSYRRAIAYASAAAFPTPPGLNESDARKWRREHDWHPHQLRHNAATRLRKEFGIDAAQVVLGHKTLAVTQIYAEKNVEAAQRAMQAVG